MASQPLVSVITPTYNHEHYIGDCVESVLGQTYSHLEQIVIDDGSTDGTLDELAKVDDPRLTVIPKARGGINDLSTTYNKALQLASGEIIAICEGDDFWDRSMLTRLLPPLISSPEVVLSYGVTQLVTETGIPMRRFIPDIEALGNNPLVDDPYSALFNKPRGAGSLILATGYTFCFPVSTVVRSRVLRLAGGFCQPRGLPFVDLPTFLRLTVEGPFAFTPEVAGFWRQRLGSATRDRDELEVHANLIEHAKEFYRTWGDALAVAPDSDDIISSIRKAAPGAQAGMARRALLREDWKSSRHMFMQLVRTPGASALLRLGGVVGFLAAVARTPLEPVARIIWGPDEDLRRVYGLRSN